MTDALAINFVGDQRRGVGTTMTVPTAVGLFRITDEMTVVAWDEGHSIGVRHTGLVTGTGTLSVVPIDGGGSRVSWKEQLSAPLWLGGPAAETVAVPVLRRVWMANLRRLRQLVDQEPPAN